jgi:hypothetical protein
MAKLTVRGMEAPKARQTWLQGVLAEGKNE